MIKAFMLVMKKVKFKTHESNNKYNWLKHITTVKLDEKKSAKNY